MSSFENFNEVFEDSKRLGIPVIELSKAKWLYLYIQSLRPKSIFELGTGIGYTACVLGSSGGIVMTVEKDVERAEKASEHIEKHGNGVVICGDGVDMMQSLAGKEVFDVIFIDFAKRKYDRIRTKCLKLIKRHGAIIADNIKMHGCQEYYTNMMHDESIGSYYVDIDDGILISSYDEKLLELAKQIYERCK